MSTRDSMRSRLFRLARRFAGEGLAQVILVDRTGAVTVLACPPVSSSDADLSLVERTLMEAAGREPLTGDELTRKAGYVEGGHPRSALARLVRLGLLVKVRGEGYRLP